MSRSLNRKVTFHSISLSFKGLKINKLFIHKYDGITNSLSIYLDSLYLQPDLKKLFQKKIIIKKIIINTPVLTVSKEIIANEKKFFEERKSSNKKKLPVSLQIDEVEIENGKVAYLQKNKKYNISIINLNLKFLANKKINLNFSGYVKEFKNILLQGNVLIKSNKYFLPDIKVLYKNYNFNLKGNFSFVSNILVTTNFIIDNKGLSLNTKSFVYNISEKKLSYNLFLKIDASIYKKEIPVVGEGYLSGVINLKKYLTFSLLIEKGIINYSKKVFNINSGNISFAKNKLSGRLKLVFHNTISYLKFSIPSFKFKRIKFVNLVFKSPVIKFSSFSTNKKFKNLRINNTFLKGIFYPERKILTIKSFETTLNPSTIIKCRGNLNFKNRDSFLFYNIRNLDIAHIRPYINFNLKVKGNINTKGNVNFAMMRKAKIRKIAGNLFLNGRIINTGSIYMNTVYKLTNYYLSFSNMNIFLNNSKFNLTGNYNLTEKVGRFSGRGMIVVHDFVKKIYGNIHTEYRGEIKGDNILYTVYLKNLTRIRSGKIEIDKISSKIEGDRNSFKGYISGLLYEGEFNFDIGMDLRNQIVDIIGEIKKINARPLALDLLSEKITGEVDGKVKLTFDIKNKKRTGKINILMEKGEILYTRYQKKLSKLWKLTEVEDIFVRKIDLMVNIKNNLINLEKGIIDGFDQYYKIRGKYNTDTSFIDVIIYPKFKEEFIRNAPNPALIFILREESGWYFIKEVKISGTPENLKVNYIR